MKTQGKLIDITLSYIDQSPIVSFEIKAELEDIAKYKDIELDISFDKRRKRRSLDANACLWACLGQIAAAVGTDNWTEYLRALRQYGKYTYINVKEEAIEDLRRQWREIDVVGDIVVIDDVTGELTPMKQVLCFFGSSTYNSKEFSRLLDGVISDMKDLGLEAPMHDDMRAIIAEMERNEQRRREQP